MPKLVVWIKQVIETRNLTHIQPIVTDMFGDFVAGRDRETGIATVNEGERSHLNRRGILRTAKSWTFFSTPGDGYNTQVSTTIQYP